VRLCDLLSDQCFATDQVFATSDGLEVLRVDAATVAAEVVNVEFVRDWTDESLVGEPMDEDSLASAPVIELSVAGTGQCRCPFPTFFVFALIDFPPEANHL